MTYSPNEVIKFLIVGGVTFVIDYGLLYLLTEYGGCTYLVSSALAFSIAVLVNYLLCISFVFSNANRGGKQLVLFAASSIAGLAINQVCMWVMVDLLNLYYMLAKLGATGIVTLWNYFAKKKALELA